MQLQPPALSLQQPCALAFGGQRRDALLVLLQQRLSLYAEPADAAVEASQLALRFLDASGHPGVRFLHLSLQLLRHVGRVAYHLQPLRQQSTDVRQALKCAVRLLPTLLQLLDSHQALRRSGLALEQTLATAKSPKGLVQLGVLRTEGEALLVHARVSIQRGDEADPELPHRLQTALQL
eukprot:scaffold7402_cov220-Pinguiococcus_pyrenoidosus.AAC.3